MVHSYKVPQLTSRCCTVCTFCLCLRGGFSFLPHSKDMLVRLFGDAKPAVGED